VAARAGARERDRSLPDAHPALAVALGAGRGAGRVGAAAVAGWADLRSLNGKRGREAAQGVEEPDLELRLDVAPASRWLASRAALAEDIAEHVLEVRIAAEPCPRSAAGLPGLRLLAIGARFVGIEAALDASHTELVVELALLRVAEHIVRLGDRLETLLGLAVARIHIRVVLARQLAVALLDFVSSRRPRDAESSVEVFLRHRAAGR
jgi:hypothetical protein